MRNPSRLPQTQTTQTRRLPTMQRRLGGPLPKRHKTRQTAKTPTCRPHPHSQQLLNRPRMETGGRQMHGLRIHHHRRNSRLHRLRPPQPTRENIHNQLRDGQNYCRRITGRTNQMRPRLPQLSRITHTPKQTPPSTTTTHNNPNLVRCLNHARAQT